MQSELHEKAHAMVDRSMVEGISPDEQRWLANHISQCAECSQYAELSQRTIRALDSFAFDLDPEVALRTQNIIRARADRVASHGPEWSIAISAAFVLTIVGSIAMWESAGWLAGRWNVPAPTWQIGFALLWVLPSVLLDALLLFRGRLIAAHRDHPRGEGAIR